MHLMYIPHPCHMASCIWRKEQARRILEGRRGVYSMEDHQQRYERAHALGVFGFGGGGPLGREWEERKTKEMMDKEGGS
jgi:hypothetical protein